MPSLSISAIPTAAAGVSCCNWARRRWASAFRAGCRLGFALTGVDLRTGQVVWFNRLSNASEQLKDAKGAGTTIDQELLSRIAAVMHGRRPLLAGAAWLALAGPLAAAPLPPPGYEADRSGDEAGLWMQVDKLEGPAEGGAQHRA